MAPFRKGGSAAGGGGSIPPALRATSLYQREAFDPSGPSVHLPLQGRFWRCVFAQGGWYHKALPPGGRGRPPLRCKPTFTAAGADVPAGHTPRQPASLTFAPRQRRERSEPSAEGTASRYRQQTGAERCRIAARTGSRFANKASRVQRPFLLARARTVFFSARRKEDGGRIHAGRTRRRGKDRVARCPRVALDRCR